MSMNPETRVSTPITLESGGRWCLPFCFLGVWGVPTNRISTPAVLVLIRLVVGTDEVRGEEGARRRRNRSEGVGSEVTDRSYVENGLQVSSPGDPRREETVRVELRRRPRHAGEVLVYGRDRDGEVSFVSEESGRVYGVTTRTSTG